MATKKGLCPYCKTIRVDRRIFPVNPEASTCFCPICMSEMEPKSAIDNYRNFLDEELQRADKTLFVTCDPVLAYQEYADIIEYEPKEAHALLGRILCLIYMGKVRKSYLVEAYTLLENTSYEGCNLNDYVFFLKKINFALDEYDAALSKRLTFKTYFYDEACLKLYLTHLYEIISLKELIFSIIKEMKKKYVSQQNEVLYNLIEHSIDEKKRILKLEYLTANGSSYKYNRMTPGGVTVDKTNHDVETHLSRYRLSTLDENDKKNKYIKDEIFKDYTKVIKAKIISLFFAIFFFVITAGLGVASYFFKDDVFFFYTFIGAAGLSFTITILCFIFHLYWRRVLNKRKLRLG